MTIINTITNLKDKILNKNIENITPVADENLKTCQILPEPKEGGVEEKTETKEQTKTTDTIKNQTTNQTDLLDLALITNGAENTNINFDNKIFEIKKRLQKKLFEKQFTDSDMTFLTKVMSEIVFDFIKKIQEEYNSLKELIKLETFFGGEKNFNEVAKQITMWATKNLPPDLFNNLNTTYLGVISLYNMMNTEDQSFIEQDFDKNFLTENDLKSMMKNPKYWKDQDKNFVKQVTDGWKYLDTVN